MSDANAEAQPLDTEVMDALPKKSPVPMILAGAGAIALAVGVWLSLRTPSTAAAGPAEAPAHGAEGAALAGSVINLDSLVVNLNDAEELHYLKCTVAVELDDPRSAALIERQTVRIRNGLLLFLSNLRLADTIGIENKEKIQQGLKARLIEMLGAPVVKAVYLTEFVLQ